MPIPSGFDAIRYRPEPPPPKPSAAKTPPPDFFRVTRTRRTTDS
jgi:hypothetical protein